MTQSNNQTNEPHVQSHIQLTKRVMKSFANKNGKFYYYDVAKGIIGSNGAPNSINTETYYFSKEMETWLNKNIESPFHAILSYINTNIKNGFSITVDENFMAAVKTYVQALLIRDPDAKKVYEQNSFTDWLCSEQAQHDMLVYFGTKEKFAELFDNYSITLAINKTTIPFVLPNCGVYEFKSKGQSHLNFPIDPYLSIVLVPNSVFYSLINDAYGIDVLNIEKNEDVEYLNQLAFATQLSKNWGYVISNHKETLKQLIP